MEAGGGAGERPGSLEEFFLRFPCDARAQEVLGKAAPEVIDLALQTFKPPREGEADYSALLMSFVKRSSRSGESRPRREEPVDLEALQFELDELFLRYPVDESARAYLLNCPPEVQHSVAREFKPQREGESDYSALLISYTKPRRNAFQAGGGGGGGGGAHGGGHAGGGGQLQRDLEHFMERYPLDESARNYLVNSPPPIQRLVLQDFKPPREGEPDYSALVISFTKRCKAQGQHAQQQQQQHQQHPQQQFEMMASMMDMMQQTFRHQQQQLQQPRQSFSSGAALQAEVNRFVQRFPLDDNAYNYLVNSPPDVQWTVLKSFSPPRQGEQDYSALLISFTKRCRQSMPGQGQPQQPMQQHQHMGGGGGGGGGYRGPPSRLHEQLEHFMRRYPLDDSARNYLASCSPEVQWHILDTFRPPREGESDYSALLISFAKRSRQSQGHGGQGHGGQGHFQQPPAFHEQPPRFDGWGPGGGGCGGGCGGGFGGGAGGGQMVDERLVMQEVERFMHSIPMDDSARNYLLNSPPEVQWTVISDFKPNRPDSDYSPLVISFTKRCRQGQHQLRPLPMVSAGYGGPPRGRPSGAGSWAAPPRGGPRPSAAPQMPMRRPHAAMAGIPQDASLEVQDFCGRYPIDEQALSYLLNLPPDVQEAVIRDFKPKVDGESDYSALVISFSKRCRLMSSQRPSAAALEPAGFGDDSGELEAFRARFPMDDRAFSTLQELPPEARRQVLDTFVPKRKDDTDYSAPVMAYSKVCRARAAESAAHTALHMAAEPVGHAEFDEFFARYPVDARAVELVTQAPPVVARRVLQEFRPKREGDADYSAAVVAFLGICRRSAMGGGSGGGYAGPPSKRPRFY